MATRLVKIRSGRYQTPDGRFYAEQEGPERWRVLDGVDARDRVAVVRTLGEAREWIEDRRNGN